MRSLIVIAGALVTFCIGPALGVTTYDVTSPGSWAMVNGARWESFDPDSSTGTGVFEPFVRIQANGVESGFNTDGAVQLDTKPGTWTHSLLISDVPYVDGYREFLLDADQTGSKGGVFLTVDELVISLEASGSLIGGFSGPIVYDLDSGADRSVRIDASLFASGSGTGDIRVLIPNELFVGSNQYVYLYAVMGEYDAANNGFEEWGVRVGGTPPPSTPAPGAVLLSSLGVGLVGWLRRRKSL